MVNRGPANGGMILCVYVYICLCLRLTLSWPSPPPHCQMASRLDDAALPDSLQVGKKRWRKKRNDWGWEKQRVLLISPGPQGSKSSPQVQCTATQTGRNGIFSMHMQKVVDTLIHIYINHTLTETHAHKNSHKTCTTTHTFYYVWYSLGILKSEEAAYCKMVKI